MLRALAAFLAALGCGPLAQSRAVDDGAMRTAVAATLTAMLPPTSTPSPSPTLEPTLSPSPATAMPTHSPTPPPGGVSLNCDGTYQRVRVLDEGSNGKTIAVDVWNGGSWSNVWSLSSGNPMIRQLQDGAGAYPFGGCQQLVLLPVLYSGSGGVVELQAFAWDGRGMTQVYDHQGPQASWSKVGATIVFHEAVYLHGEPNCCPCARQTLEYTWNGAAFVQTGSELSPTFSGTPPIECAP